MTSGSISRTRTAGSNKYIYLKLWWRVAKLPSVDIVHMLDTTSHAPKRPFPPRAHLALGAVILLHLCQFKEWTWHIRVWCFNFCFFDHQGDSCVLITKNSTFLVHFLLNYVPMSFAHFIRVSLFFFLVFLSFNHLSTMYVVTVSLVYI